MKFSISWHQDSLKNKKAHYAREREIAIQTLLHCDKADSECAFYERQINEAIRLKMKDFDRDKFTKGI